MNKLVKFLWKNRIYDSRLPHGCKIFPGCMTCPAYCNWKKIAATEFKNDYDKQYELRECDGY